MIAYLNDIPDCFKQRSELYKATVLETPDEMVENKHKRKLNFAPNTANFLEILEYIDTCSYIDCDFWMRPFFLERCANRKAAVLREMHQFEVAILKDINTKWSEYSYFVKTYEYHAVKVLYKYYSSCDMNIHAIRSGSLILFRCCVEWTTKEAHAAVYHGRIDILDYIHGDIRGKARLSNTWFQQQLCLTAVSNNDVNMLHYLRETLLFDWDESSLEAAIVGEHCSCIEYIMGNNTDFVKKRERGFPITYLSIKAAIAKNGRQLRNGCESSELVSYLLNA